MFNVRKIAHKDISNIKKNNDFSFYKFKKCIRMMSKNVYLENFLLYFAFRHFLCLINYVIHNKKFISLI